LIITLFARASLKLLKGNIIMSAPNIEGTSNPTSTGGNSAGAKVGESTTQTVGFYGSTGVAKQTGVAVSAAGVHAALVALGLIAA
jgi:hypothetical protein